VAGDDAAGVQDEVLEGLAAAVNYRRWICDLAEPWLGDDPLEVGAGTGDYAAEWAARGLRLTASEPEPGRRAKLEARFRDDPRVEVADVALPIASDQRRSAVVGINVLEHIEDDAVALTSIARSLRPGGHVVLFVPAFPIGMSRFDREVGHFRRYRRAPLGELLVATGFTPVRLHHVNAPGLLAWIVLMRLAGRRPSEGVALRIFETLVPALQRLEERWPPPFGQSLFAVGRRR
jgi:SAM-dependent methyltransferase